MFGRVSSLISSKLKRSSTSSSDVHQSCSSLPARPVNGAVKFRVIASPANNPISTPRSASFHRSTFMKDTTKDGVAEKVSDNKTFFDKIKEGAAEFSLAVWQGTKELYHNFWECKRLEKLQSQGTVLTRAELRFIKKHKSDLWKLGPFLFIQLLPGSLLILPVYLAAVPGALPSTLRIALFQEKARIAAEQSRRESSSSILNYLRTNVVVNAESSSLHSMISSSTKENTAKVLELVDKNSYVRPADVIPLNKSFETLFDVVEMERDLLRQSCRLFTLPAFSFMPNPLLIASLNKHFDYLQADDKMIRASVEGLNSLADWELHEFCAERGLLDLNLSREQMLVLANDWLSLSADASLVPATFITFSASNAKANVPHA